MSLQDVSSRWCLSKEMSLNLRILVYLVIQDSGYMSFELLLTSRHPTLNLSAGFNLRICLFKVVSFPGVVPI